MGSLAATLHCGRRSILLSLEEDVVFIPMVRASQRYDAISVVGVQECFGGIGTVVWIVISRDQLNTAAFDGEWQNQ